MVEAVHPDILHLCGPEDGLTFEDLNRLRELLPGKPIMQAISVDGPEAIERALSYQEFADYLILDTQTEDVIGIGASGRTHDWHISRKIVQSVRIPVILAGGLTVENVAEAIQQVRPWAVDSLTHTNHYLPDGRFYKNLARIEAFVSHAKGA
jgi:phosphoribosylanthranilate isomerase